MKLTIEETKKILENERGKIKNARWYGHSICVGETAGKIAKALNEKGNTLDIDKAIVLGMIHDIGKVVELSSGHDIKGYYYMKEHGYDEDYCNICLTHSYLNNDVNCVAGGFPKDVPFRTDFIKNHDYTIYEKIVNLCDLMCTDIIMTVDKRLIDLIIRKGSHSNTQYHISETYKLKEYY